LCGSINSKVAPSSAKAAIWSIRLDKKTASHAQIIARNRNVPLDDKIAVKRLCRDIGTDAARDVIKLGMARGERDSSALEWLDAIVKNGECVSLKQLAVSGEEVIAVGIEPKNVGKYLDKALDLVISDEAVNEREAIISVIKTIDNK